MTEPTGFYRCTLDACVWTTDPNVGKPAQPHMRFWYDKELVAEVYLRMDDAKGRDRWMLRMYPAGGEEYLPPQEEPRVQDPRRFLSTAAPPDRATATERRGTISARHRGRRDPAGYRKFGEEMSKGELEGVTKVAELMRPVLQRLTANYVTRFRPRQS